MNLAPSTGPGGGTGTVEIAVEINVGLFDLLPGMGHVVRWSGFRLISKSLKINGFGIVTAA